MGRDDTDDDLRLNYGVSKRPCVGAWFGQDPDDFIEIVTGGAKYTTPQLGDVDPVVVEDDDDDGDDGYDDDDDDEGGEDVVCYSSRPYVDGGAVDGDAGARGAGFELDDPWLIETGGGWCCDDFPALRECEVGVAQADSRTRLTQAWL